MIGKFIICHLVGDIFYPRKHNGNMPVKQAQKPCIPGGMILIPHLQTMVISWGSLKLPGNMEPIFGAFLICMEMSGNGRQICTDCVDLSICLIQSVPVRVPKKLFAEDHMKMMSMSFDHPIGKEVTLLIVSGILVFGSPTVALI